MRPFGREPEDLTGVRWDAVTEISLRTTGRGPFEEDVFFVFAYADGPSTAIGLGDTDYLLPRLQQLPGFDNEAFVRAMGISEEGSSVLWRR